MKKVTFNESLNQVHTMYKYNYAYKSARMSNWKSIALDRIRFSARIKEASIILSPVLDVGHRNNVYDKIKQFYT